MKTIRELGLNPAPFVSLMDRECSVFVDPGTGDILMDEGTGQDRWNGAVLLAEKNPRFVLAGAASTGAARLRIQYRDMDFDLGDASQVRDPAAWVIAANEILAKARLHTPVDLPELSGLSLAGSAVTDDRALDEGTVQQCQTP